jgi:DNA polymerase III gamma/tau subunit
MFILATTELNQGPGDHPSRCQRHSFKRLDTESHRWPAEYYVAAQEGLRLRRRPPR